jgi:hypothetical protein
VAALAAQPRRAHEDLRPVSTNVRASFPCTAAARCDRPRQLAEHRSRLPKDTALNSSGAPDQFSGECLGLSNGWSSAPGHFEPSGLHGNCGRTSKSARDASHSGRVCLRLKIWSTIADQVFVIRLLLLLAVSAALRDGAAHGTAHRTAGSGTCAARQNQAAGPNFGRTSGVSAPSTVPSYQTDHRSVPWLCCRSRGPSQTGRPRRAQQHAVADRRRGQS